MKKIIKATIWFGGFLVAVFALANLVVILSARSQVFDEVDALESAKVALVLGTSKFTVDGTENLFFKDRIESAAQLYHAGSVKHVILSGDNRSVYYNEPRDMLAALTEQGVPRASITLDYAGLRTLDSIVRCKEIFGQEDIIIVTQRWHTYRAIFIANHFGLSAQAYMANINSQTYPSILLREMGARIQAVADLYLLNRKPQIMGEKEELHID